MIGLFTFTPHLNVAKKCACEDSPGVRKVQNNDILPEQACDVELEMIQPAWRGNARTFWPKCFPVHQLASPASPTSIVSASIQHCINRSVHDTFYRVGV